MKKKTFFTMVLILALCIISSCYADVLNADKVLFKIFYEGSDFLPENTIALINGKTYMALSDLSNLFGFKAEWNAEDKSINIKKFYADDGEYSEEEMLYPFEENGLWGYKDKSGETIVYPQYCNAEDFSNGLGLVRSSSGQDGNFGFINNKGEEVIPCIYPYAESFKEGFAAVNLSNRTDIFVWKYIDRKGNYASELSFDERAENFENGYAVVKDNGKWGLIDRNFNFVEPCIYDTRDQIIIPKS